MDNAEFKRRIPIWMALSDFYLDTELQEHNFLYIAKVIRKSGFSISEVKKIDKYEIFPVLQPNLLSVAGEWAGFEEKWLVAKIKTHLKSTWFISRLKTQWMYRKFRWMHKDYWEKLEQVLTQPDS